MLSILLINVGGRAAKVKLQNQTRFMKELEIIEKSSLI